MTLTDPATMTATLQVGTTTCGRIAVLALDGELTAQTADELAAHTVKGPGLASDVVLDLQHLYVIDENGIAALEEFAADLARAGRCLALAALRPRTRAFLQYVDAQALAPIYGTVEEASDHLALARTAGA